MGDIYYDPNTNGIKSNRRWFHNVKLIGELDKGTSIYIEDYVYTYLHQYGASDFSSERSAVLLGEYYEEADQVVVYGVIPISEELLGSDTRWINKEVLDKLEIEKSCYFPASKYIGWMHTQPGYGIMLTTQEIKTHKEVFGEEGLLLLMDPIHKAETFYTYKNSELVERYGFCMYYERNEPMQHYMIDHPIVEKEKNQEQDDVVISFREMGARRKREVERRKRMNMIVSFTLTFFLLIAALVTGIYEQQRKISELEKDINSIYEEYSSIKYKTDDNPVELVFHEKNDTLVQEVEDLNELEKTEKIEEQAIETQYDIHAVQTGDSLLDISYKYYNTVKMAKKIAEINNIKNQDTIYIGQKLKLPRVTQ